MDLRAKLESVDCMEWPFEFWDVNEKCMIKRTFEGMNLVEDRIYVIPACEVGDEGPTKRGQIETRLCRDGEGVVSEFRPP